MVHINLWYCGGVFGGRLSTTHHGKVYSALVDTHDADVLGLVVQTAMRRQFA
jgi:hypothetical protein